MTLPLVPPFSRYASSGRFGFILERSPDLEIADILSSEDFVLLNINPQQVTFSEPFATAVTPTQGGGKLRESRGLILRNGSISGTTGFLPKGAPIHKAGVRIKLDESPAAEADRAHRSGFAAFHKLRQLFRIYGNELRQGNLDVRMHYVDFKNDEFWEIEPQAFNLARSSKRPYLYEYTINFTAIDPSGHGDYLEMLSGSLVSPYTNTDAATLARDGLVDASEQTPLESLRGLRLQGAGVKNWPASPQARQALTRMKMLSGGRVLGTTNGGLLGYMKHLSGNIQQSAQGVLRDMSAVFQVFDDAYTAAHTLFLDTPVNLLKQLSSTIDGCFAVVEKFGSSSVKRELGAWLLEVTALVDQLTEFTVATNSAIVGNRMKEENDRYTRSRGGAGSSDDLMREPAGSPGPLKTDPFIGKSGLGLVMNIDKAQQTKTLKPEAILRGETIQDVAVRTLKSVHRFIELIALNNLEFPYIVADAAKKPPNTLAWGEYILIPSNDTAKLNDEEPVSADVVAYTHTVSTVGAADELIDDDKPNGEEWYTDQWVGYTVTLTSGAGAGQARVVTANNTTTLSVNRDWDVVPNVGDTYALKLVTFDLRRSVTADVRTFGRDALLVFDRLGTSGSPSKGTVKLNARGDIATIAGIENFYQALTLMSSVARGQHPIHKRYGIAKPVGRMLTSPVIMLYSHYTRQALLSDPRVQAVGDVSFISEGGSVFINIEVTPRLAKRARPFRSKVV